MKQFATVFSGTQPLSMALSIAGKQGKPGTKQEVAQMPVKPYYKRNRQNRSLVCMERRIYFLRTVRRGFFGALAASSMIALQSSSVSDSASVPFGIL